MFLSHFHYYQEPGDQGSVVTSDCCVMLHTMDTNKISDQVIFIRRSPQPPAPPSTQTRKRCLTMIILVVSDIAPAKIFGLTDGHFLRCFANQQIACQWVFSSS